MTGGPSLPLLWLCGPPGAGKSAVAWEIFVRLQSRGMLTAYVDIDQLGMCYPEPPSDPGRHRLKAAGLAATAANYRAAGARCLIVSGVIDAEHGVGPIPGAEVTLCRLRCDEPDLLRRLQGRGTAIDELPAVLLEARAMDHSPISCVDSTGLAVDGVATRVIELSGGWPHAGPGGGTEPSVTPAAAAGPILWICGARAVGKSTIGFRVYERVRRSGLTAGFLDLDQVGFLRPLPPDDPRRHPLRARNLAAVWDRFRDAGADCLVVVGPIERPEVRLIYAEAVPRASLTLCRLDAGPVELARRAAIRGQGGGPGIAGDDLRGMTWEDLGRVTMEAVTEGDAMWRSCVGDVAVQTDRLGIDEAADRVLAAAGDWPGLG